MDDAIRHLRLAYHSFGDDRSEAAAAAARLDAVVRVGLAAQYGAALEAAFGDDESSVYVLRKVHVSAAIVSYEGLTDSALTETLARRMAGSVVRTIQRDAGDGANLVRFESDDDFIAQFVISLADAQAWDHWYFFPFRAVREMPVAEAIRTVLLDNRQDLPKVLAALRRKGALERVCRALGARELGVLWADGFGEGDGSGHGGRGGGGEAPEAFRPLFAAAVTVIDRGCLWAGVRPASELERLFGEYLRTGPSPAVWSDRRGLALVVLEIISFLARRGLLRSDGEGESGRLAAGDGTNDRSDGRGRRDSNHLNGLSDLDWLDTEYLVSQLPKLLSGARRHDAAGLPRELTPRQARIAAELSRLLATGVVALDGTDPASAANRLRLFAALAEHAEQPADQAFAREAVENVLLAWTLLAGTDRAAVDRAAIVDGLRRGRIGDALAAATRGAAAGAGARAVGFVAAMFGGRAAADAMTALLARSPLTPGTGVHHARSAEGEMVPQSAVGGRVRCAGVFLLARAVLDTHLPTIVASAAADRAENPPRLDNLLAALALRWGGPSAADARATGARVVDTGAVDAGAAERCAAAANAAGACATDAGAIGADAVGAEVVDNDAVDADTVGADAADACAADANPADASAAEAYAVGANSADADDVIDDGVAAFAGLPAPASFAALRDEWAAIDDSGVRALQEGVFTMLAGVRAISGGVLRLHALRSEAGPSAIIGGDDSGSIWPLAAIADESSVAAVVRRWIDVWAEALGQPPIVVTAERWIRESLALAGIAAIEPESRGEADAGAGVSDDGRAQLLRAFEAIGDGQLGLPAIDLAIGSIALSLLRVWARWLGHFAESTATYLLDRFIRRPGYVDADETGVLVTLDARPLDMVIEMAGYTAVVPMVPWLAGRPLRFARAPGP